MPTFAFAMRRSGVRSPSRPLFRIKYLEADYPICLFSLVANLWQNFFTLAKDLYRSPGLRP